jgi:hypothetical protein
MQAAEDRQVSAVRNNDGDVPKRNVELAELGDKQ